MNEVQIYSQVLHKKLLKEDLHHNRFLSLLFHKEKQHSEQLSKDVLTNKGLAVVLPTNRTGTDSRRHNRSKIVERCCLTDNYIFISVLNINVLS